MHTILKNLRKTKGITQEDLSMKIHVSRQTISNWERGYSIPDSENLRLLSEFYGISINFLMGVEINNTNETKDNILVKKNKEYTYFLYTLAIASFCTPLAAFVLFYFVYESKVNLTIMQYKYLKNYAIILSALNIIIIVSLVLLSLF